MAQVTRRNFLGTASLAAAGAAMGPWVRRAGAQAGPVKIGLVLPYSGVYAVLGEPRVTVRRADLRPRELDLQRRSR